MLILRGQQFWQAVMSAVLSSRTLVRGAVAVQRDDY